MNVGRYRPIFVRIWGDEKFRSLSKGVANAQILWFYMLTNPQTTIIPGLYSAGQNSLAEGIGWGLPNFMKFYGELEKAEMIQADWDARVIWIPNGIRYNKPHNPLVVKGWDSVWPEIPECDLKRDAHQHLSAELLSYGVSYQKVFLENCAITPPMIPPIIDKKVNSGTEGSAPKQEQEQEQDKDQDQDELPPLPAGASAHEWANFNKFRKAYGTPFKAWDAAFKAFAKRKFNDLEVDDILDALAIQVPSHDWTKENKKFRPMPASYINGGYWKGVVEEHRGAQQDDPEYAPGEHTHARGADG